MTKILKIILKAWIPKNYKKEEDLKIEQIVFTISFNIL
jgi:hypothetical protein